MLGERRKRRMENPEREESGAGQSAREWSEIPADRQLRTGEGDRIEALVRWRHATRGYARPEGLVHDRRRLPA